VALQQVVYVIRSHPGGLVNFLLDTTSLEAGIGTGKGCLDHACSVRVDDGLDGGISTDSKNEDTCGDRDTER